MIFFPIFLLASVILLAWLIAQWPNRSAGEVSVASTSGFVALVGLLLALALLSASVWMVAWSARGGDWDWRWQHMSRMMRWDRTAAGSTLQTDATEVAVQIRNFAYQPQTLNVRVGTRVTWTNDDAVPHTATDHAGKWDTGILNRGGSASQTFQTVGAFSYYCSVHPTMTGAVVVRE